MSEKIEIFVACHKPSELPDNKLFIPIHVGAAKSNFVMEGLKRDDEGDNISEKNANYCELTAQYWAWKHSTADYVGLCHYRRYLCFSSKRFDNLVKDNRKWIDAKALTPETEAKYGLLNEEEMRAQILSHDVFVCEAQDLPKVILSREMPKTDFKSTLEHWEGLDGIIINVKDLHKMFDIVKSDYPDFYVSMMEYMNDKYFYGYNTFVMRRDLFNQMCEIEFSILEKLEQFVDMSKYDIQMSRIYGFMGEIIFSSYVHHLKKTVKNLRVKECQMIFFEKTDKINTFTPKSEDSLKIAVDLGVELTFLLQPFLSQFLRHASKNLKYELLILGEKLNPQFVAMFKESVKNYSNISINFFETDKIFAAIDDIYERYITATPLYLAWILPNYDKCLYFQWNTFIEDDISKIYNTNLNGKCIAASQDVLNQGILNDRKNSTNRDKRSYASGLGIEDIFSFVSDRVLLMDLAAIRNNFTVDDIMNKLIPITDRNQFKFDFRKKSQRNNVYLFNKIFCGHVTFMPQEYNHFVVGDFLDKANVDNAPLSLRNEYKSSYNQAIVRNYNDDMTWHWNDDKDLIFFTRYWQVIDESKLRYIFNVYCQHNNIKEFFNPMYLIDRLLPTGSSRREKVKKLFPKNGFLYRTIKRFLVK